MGDVICVKLKDFADWGAMERRVHMTVDWRDEDLENQMREDGLTTIITPYKTTEECAVYSDENENQIFFGNVTKSRSVKYYNIELGIQSEKTDSEILEEFEKNKEFVKNEIIREKPSPESVLRGAPIEDNEAYTNYLIKLKEDLSKLNIVTEIIDGKLVRV